MSTWFENVDVGSMRLWRDEPVLMFASLLLPVLWLLPAYANAAAVCDYYEFRDAMAHQNVAQFEALLATCRAPRSTLPQEKGGSTLLHLAAHVGRQLAPEFTRRLLAAGADPLARDAQGNLPLHRIWHPDLLVTGVNARNDAGLTPLHHAALAGSVWRIDKLVESGADGTLRTTKASHWRAAHMSRSFGPGIPIPAGATPYDLARQRQRETRFVTHAHDAAVNRLKDLTPQRGR